MADAREISLTKLASPAERVLLPAAPLDVVAFGTMGSMGYWAGAGVALALASCGPKESGGTPPKPDANLTAPAPPATGGVPSESTAGGGPTEAPSGNVADLTEATQADLMTFASGAIPLSASSSGAKKGVQMEEAIEAIDGKLAPYAMVNQATSGAVTEFLYLLPANTTFERFSVPNVRETPSKYITFTKGVEVHGSATSANSGFKLLARGTLSTHPKRDQETELELLETEAVKWVKLRLIGGIRVENDESTFQFSELIAHGKQETPALSTGFKGMWGVRQRGLELKQTGAVVSGCYDGVAELSGTVSGNILKARGVEPRNKVVSLFVLTVMPDGTIRGVRSTNGAPFHLVDFPSEAGESRCPALAQPAVGCGSILHGINFEYNSAEIRPESGVLLGQLFESLKRDKASKILIEGHTSNEGSDQYNLDLSKRRAEAVVADLVKRGLPKARIAATGRGEASPIAPNTDETGRSLNRRVEVKCN